MPFSDNITVVDSYSLASPVERILAFAIDYGIAIGLFWIPYVGGILSFLYLVFRDKISWLNNQSLGKKLLGIKVIKEGKFLVSYKSSIKRNFLFFPNIVAVLPHLDRTVFFTILILNIIFFCIEAFLLFTSSDTQRLGDQFAETLVIEQ